MKFEQWNDFNEGEWKYEINVRDFIQKNYTPYEGTDEFLDGVKISDIESEIKKSNPDAPLLVSPAFCSSCRPYR